MDNVVNVSGVEFELKEGSYWKEVFSILEKKLKGFDYYLFVMHDNCYDKGEHENLNFDHPRKILIHGGEEKFGALENLKKKYFHIFAPYYWKCENVTPIPLGYYGTINEEFERVSISERIYDLNFVGSINRNRVHLATNLLNINSIWFIVGLFLFRKRFLKWINYYLYSKNNNDVLQFNHDFICFTDSGINKKDFINRLRLSKIALCPKGFHNTECFRMYEAMRYGCVVIAEELPERNFYKNIPIFQVKNWKDGITLAKILLKDESLLEKLSAESRSWYEMHLSPEATAKIMIDKINEINSY